MSRIRGQTTLDFAIGVSIFLLSVAFVLAFVPGMVQPFTANPQEEMPVADRVATQLVQEMLTGTDPYVLDTDCTVDFFRPDATGHATCPFGENDLSSGGTVTGRLGINAEHEIQVHIQGDLDGDGTSELLCWDTTNRLLVEQDAAACGSSDHTFSVGGTPPSTGGSTNSAVRIASLRNYDVTVEVQTW